MTALPILPKTREEIIEILSCEEYGTLPSAPEHVDVIFASENATGSCAGKASERHYRVEFEAEKGRASIPFAVVRPLKIKHAPVFLHIAFRREIPDRYLPVEEIIDHGFAVALVCYEDITPDGCFGGGIADLYDREWGKISMWAFGAQRVMDALYQIEEGLDLTRVAVVGHSRLGKTALWCGGLDTRFSLSISNDSGCSGAALFRGKEGELIKDITKNFPFWFHPKFLSYVGKENELPFDQHFLLALSLPRHVIVSSATLDAWACPVAEEAAVKALHDPDHTKYYLREGTHFLSRTDWLNFMAYRKEKNV